MKRIARVLLLLSGIAALFLALFFSSPTVQYFATSVAIWAIFAMGFDLAFGLAGLLSFGHAAFFAVGAYATALASTKYGIPVSFGILISAILAGLVAAAVGMLALRLSGVYLALTTLAVAQLIETLVAVRWRSITGGLEGIVNIPRPVLGSIRIEDDRSYFVFVFLIFLLVLALVSLLRTSPWGRALVAMRLNEVRAQQIGFDVLRLKIGAFAVSGAISGVSGALLAMLMRFVNPEVLGWTISGDVLIATLMGGSGTLLGPALGALMMALFREGLEKLTTHWHGLLGVVLILVTLYMPNGAAGVLAAMRARWRKA
jgi:branched-chain amino acid transport system permease protein